MSMRLDEISLEITTYALEKERKEVIDTIYFIIENKLIIKDIRFTELLGIASEIMKKYRIEDNSFKEIFDALSAFISYYKENRI